MFLNVNIYSRKAVLYYVKKQIFKFNINEEKNA